MVLAAMEQRHARSDRIGGRARQRTPGADVQVCLVLKDRKLAAELGGGPAPTGSASAVSWIAFELGGGGSGKDFFDSVRGPADELRAAYARVLHADASDVRPDRLDDRRVPDDPVGS
jgi:hypothetical protein